MMTWGEVVGFISRGFYHYRSSHRDATLAFAEDPGDGLGGEPRRAGRLDPARVDVGDHLAVGVGGPRRRPVDVVGGQAVGIAEPGTLAADEQRRLGLEEAGDLVHDLDARAAHEERRAEGDPRRGELLLQGAVVGLAVLVERRRRQPVAVDDLEAGGAGTAALDLGARLVG